MKRQPELAAALTRLAAALGYPILADPLSGLRCGGHEHTLVLDSYDAFLRDSRLTAREIRPSNLLGYWRLLRCLNEKPASTLD